MPPQNRESRYNQKSQVANVIQYPLCQQECAIYTNQTIQDKISSRKERKERNTTSRKPILYVLKGREKTDLPQQPNATSSADVRPGISQASPLNDNPNRKAKSFHSSPNITRWTSVSNTKEKITEETRSPLPTMEHFSPTLSGPYMTRTTWVNARRLSRLLTPQATSEQLNPRH